MVTFKLKPKKWWWTLTYPFAHNNITTIGHTIYHPPLDPPSIDEMEHEKVHILQMETTGTIKFYFLYLFCLPILYNPWRFKWELEAYQHNATEAQARKILSSAMYGWLLNK